MGRPRLPAGIGLAHLSNEGAHQPQLLFTAKLFVARVPRIFRVRQQKLHVYARVPFFKCVLGTRLRT